MTISLFKLSIKIVACAFFLSSTLYAQEQDSTEVICEFPSDKETSKIVKLIESDKTERLEKIQKLTELLKENKNWGVAWHQLAYLRFQASEEKKASYKLSINDYNIALKLCPEYNPSAYYNLGVANYIEEDYAESVKNFQRFLEYGENPNDPDFEKRRASAEQVLPKIIFKRDFEKGKTATKPVLLQNSSTNENEYLPTLSPDNTLLLFTRMRVVKHLGDITTSQEEELIAADRINTKPTYAKGEPMEYPLNGLKGANYGGATLSITNNEIFFTVCIPDGLGDSECDIFTSKNQLIAKDGGEEYFMWSEPEKLTELISMPKSWESQPSLSSDGQYLYFARYNNNTAGIDIYCSKRNDKGEWQKPYALAAPVNTAGSEKAAFIHPDAKTLYFASDGITGAGGFDLFMSQQTGENSWTKPLNLGGFINTPADEHGFIVSLDGQYGFYATNKDRERAVYDLFVIGVPENVRPDEVGIIKGDIENPVEDTEIEVTTADGKVIKKIKVTRGSGSYAAIIRKEDMQQDLVVSVKKPGYAFESRVLKQSEQEANLMVAKKMKMDEIEIDKPYQINDIHFKTNSAELEKESKKVLNLFAEFLSINSSYQIDITGHTDNIGDPDKNLKLSTFRAQSVRTFLIEKGIEENRLYSKGKGEKEPIKSNESPEGRARNRRTEFTITSL